MKKCIDGASEVDSIWHHYFCASTVISDAHNNINPCFGGLFFYESSYRRALLTNTKLKIHTLPTYYITLISFNLQNTPTPSPRTLRYGPFKIQV